MTISPHVKLNIFGYGLLLFSIVPELGHEGFHFGGLIWFWVVAWAISFVLMPTVLKVTPMYPLWGWFSLFTCGALIVFGPIVPVEPLPWILYLGGAILSGFGAYLFLLDKGIARYAAALRTGNVLGEQAGRGDGDKPSN